MKRIYYLILITVLFASCKSASTAVGNKESKRENRYTVTHLIEHATDNIGVRYKAGGTTKSGYDCSGLVFTTFESENIKLPRNSFEQAKVGRIIKFNDAQKGDLIFFINRGQRRINHVGMVVEAADGEIKFVHSSTHGGVMISSTKEPYYQRSFSQVNRILE